MRLSSLCGSLALCVTLPLAAQQISTLHLDSRLVILDVTVLDKQGNPVENLDRSDFTLYEAGVPQVLSSFDAPATHRTAKVTDPSAVQSMNDVQRLMPTAGITLMVLDEMNSDFMDMAYARNSLRKYIESQPTMLIQPTALMVATDASFIQVQDYTLSRQQLLDALNHHKPIYPFQRMRMGNSGEGKVISLAQTVASLQQIAQASSGHKGRKNIVWVGNGFTTIDLRNEPDHQVQLVTGLVERTVNLLRDAHVTLYTINPTMASNGAGVIDEVQDPLTAEAHNARDPFDGTIAFNTLAPETGGRAFSLGNDIDQEIAASLRECNSYYTISYVPLETSVANQNYRQLTVKVDRPGLMARSMQGFYGAVPAPPVPGIKKERKTEGFYLGTAANSKMGYTALTIVASPSSHDLGQYNVHVTTSDIAWTRVATGNTAHLVMAVVAFDSKDKPIASVVHEANATLGPDRPLSSLPFVPLSAQIKIPANSVRLRFVVRDTVSGQMGSSDIDLRHRQAAN
jgi:VWFA-related protein